MGSAATAFTGFEPPQISVDEATEEAWPTYDRVPESIEPDAAPFVAPVSDESSDTADTPAIPTEPSPDPVNVEGASDPILADPTPNPTESRPSPIAQSVALEDSNTSRQPEDIQSVGQQERNLGRQDPVSVLGTEPQSPDHSESERIEPARADLDSEPENPWAGVTASNERDSSWAADSSDADVTAVFNPETSEAVASLEPPAWDSAANPVEEGNWHQPEESRANQPESSAWHSPADAEVESTAFVETDTAEVADVSLEPERGSESSTESMPSGLSSADYDQQDFQSDGAYQDRADSVPAGSLASQLLADIQADESNPPDSSSHLEQADQVEPFDETSTMAFDPSQVSSFASLEEEHSGSNVEPFVAPEIGEEAPTEVTEGSGLGLSTSSLMDEPSIENVSDSVLSEAEYVESTQVDDSEESISTDAQAATTNEEPATEVDDDDSIEAYMNRLLQRVQGGPTAASSPAVAEPKTETISELPEMPLEAEPEPEPIDPNAPLIARSQAPEKNTNLSAMRELANSSARTAISRSVKIQTRNDQMQAMTQFAFAGICALCATGVFFLTSQSLIKIVGLIAGVIAGVMFIREGFRMMADAKRRLLLAESGKLDSNSTDSSEFDDGISQE